MNVSCSNCRSVFRLDPAKVPAPGVQARCSVCGGIIAVAATSGPTMPAALAARPDTAEGTSVQLIEQSTRANTAVVDRLSAHDITPDIGGDAFAAAIVAPAFAAMPSRVTEQPDEAFGRPDSEPASAVPAVTSPVAAPPLVVVPVAAPPVDSAPAGAPRLARAVNPYLNNTPELRARRLARALVSDLVAYNPQKREEGLRNGTLRQLFRDEIRKSWDEYVEQVGAHVAESTPHFQDALNDVLAGGRRVF